MKNARLIPLVYVSLSGQPIDLTKPPRKQRNYEGEGRRGFTAGKLLQDCPYRYGAPRDTWIAGWAAERDERLGIWPDVT